MSNTLEQRKIEIDNHTGEILSDISNIIDLSKIPDEPAYIKFYIEDLSLINKLTAGETRILLYIAASANYNGEVLIPLVIKKRIASSADLSIQAISNAITKFCNKRILKRLDSSLYLLNPDLFAKGKWREIRERRKAFQSVTTYYADGKKVIETNLLD